MRFVVVQPVPSSRDRERVALPRVGVVRWCDPEPTLTVIVKATFSFAAAGEGEPAVAVIAPEQEPLSLGRDAEGAPEEAVYPRDFIPRKGAADVLLAGHAHADQPTGVIYASVSAGEVSRAFAVVSPIPSTRIPLAAGGVRHRHGEAATRVGAARRPARPRGDGDLSPDVGPRVHGPDFNYFAYNVAPPEQLSGWIAPDAAILLEGLSPAGRRRFRLPGLSPVVFVEARGDRVATLELACDTLWIDVDRELAVLVWRGHAEVSSPDALEVERIIVSLEPTDVGAAPSAEIRRKAMRARVSLAAEEDCLSHAPVNETEEDQLMIARYELLAHDQAPEPELLLAEYAQISAELAEVREPKADTLRRHALADDAWAVEERCWLEAMASAATRGDASLTVEYGELYVAAQDALSMPPEARRTLEEYAALWLAMDEAEDPAAVLKQWSMTLAEWMRLDRRWSAAIKADARLAEEFKRQVSEIRSRGESAAVGSELPGG